MSHPAAFPEKRTSEGAAAAAGSRVANLSKGQKARSSTQKGLTLIKTDKEKAQCYKYMIH